MSVSRVVRVQLPALVLAAICLAACGSEEPGVQTAGEESSATSSASGEPSSDAGPSAPPGTPDCGTVWKDSARLARGYRGCVKDGQYVERDVLGCSSGQRMVRFDDHYYGVLGGTVHEASTPLDRDRHYLAAVRRCRA